jgi:hypothetical protein
MMKLDFLGTHLTTLRLTSLILQETGTYNPMFLRPYNMHVDTHTSNLITNRVIEFGQGRITGNLLAGVGAHVITPQAAPEAQILIPNNWDTPRIRFMLEVCCDFQVSQRLYYIQGYTSHHGVLIDGHGNIQIDPQMEFIINSIIGVTMTEIPTPMGPQRRPMVSESVHILDDPNWAGHMNSHLTYLMRPQDVFGGLQTSYMNTHGMVLDTRGIASRQPARSNRGNNIPTEYLAKIVDSNLRSKDQAGFNTKATDALTLAKEMVTEAPLSENPFIHRISDLTTVGVTNRFRFGTLEQIDPNINNVLKLTVINHQALTPLHQIGQTAYWEGTDRVTQAATILTQAVPAMMMELMISKLHFTSTNHADGCQMYTAIVDAKSLAAVDLTRNYDIFKHRFENEVMLDLTWGNQVGYTLQMQVDLFGETWISLGLDANPPMDFVVPSFADHLFVPVLTTNKDRLDFIVNDFEELLRHNGEGMRDMGPLPILRSPI